MSDVRENRPNQALREMIKSDSVEIGRPVIKCGEKPPWLHLFARSNSGSGAEINASWGVQMLELPASLVIVFTSASVLYASS